MLESWNDIMDQAVAGIITGVVLEIPSIIKRVRKGNSKKNPLKKVLTCNI